MSTATTLPDGETEFAARVEPHRRELQVHCYRMLGSLEDAEDQVQETLLRAWRRRASFEGRSSLRTWLYRIATNACLDALERRPRHPASRPAYEVPWLEPYPDELLDQVASPEREPDAEVVAKETIELAFLVAIQQLPPRPRAVLILRDVLGWRAAETAELLETSTAAVNSALQRARAAMKEGLPERRSEWAPGTDPTSAEKELLRAYVDASERGDADAIKTLMREDARCAMPPAPQTYSGRDAIVASWIQGGFGTDELGQLRCLLTRANRQPAVAAYVRKPGQARFEALALDVLRIEEGAIADITVFDGTLFGRFGLPAEL